MYLVLALVACWGGSERVLLRRVVVVVVSYSAVKLMRGATT
jgi:hypothetical protein